MKRASFLLSCLVGLWPLVAGAGALRVGVAAGEKEAGTDFSQALVEVLRGRDVVVGDGLAGAEVVVWAGRHEAAVGEEIRKHAGGLVVVDDFARGADAAQAWQGLAGAVAGPEEARSWAGVVPLFFTVPGRAHAVSGGISNFETAAAFSWNLRLDPAAVVLATTWTPHQKHLQNGQPQPCVYGVSPVLWTLEKEGRRTVGCAVGDAAALKNPAFRAVMVRAVAWAGKRERPDDLLTPEEKASFIYPPGGPLSPEVGLKALKVHPDVTAELVAAEPLVSKVINLDWDAGGRLWVAESVEYPEGRRGGGPESMYAAWQRETPLPKPPAVERPGRDTISWLEDADGDGRMDRKHVFAGGLDMVTSFCFYRDGVIVAQPPEILLLRDTDGDGTADTREVLYAGLGTNDTHAVLNNLRWGLDGWIYATHGYSASPRVTSGDGTKNYGAINSGVVRFRPDGSGIEMVSAKGGNCWGVDITSDGELFFTQPTSGDLVMHVPVSDRLMAEGGLGREPSWKVLQHMLPVKPLMSPEEIIEQQPNDVIGSFTAACGCAIYEGGSWPAEWTRGYFTCEPTVHIVHHEAISPDGPSFAAAKAREEEFSATRDWWHRPIDTRLGPDGNVHVIDFYNQAILHNDPRGPIHLWNNQAARPDRDHFFARIYRMRHRQATALPAVDLASLDGRVAALSHPNRAVRFRAQRLLEESADQLPKAAHQLAAATGVARLHALWLRAAAGVLGEGEITSAVSDPDLSVKVTAARVLAEHPALATVAVVGKIGAQLTTETDKRATLQLLAAVPQGTPLPARHLATYFASAADPWTRATIQRNAKSQPRQVLDGCLSRLLNGPDVAPLVEYVFASVRDDPAQLAPMIDDLSTSPYASEPRMTAALRALSAGPLPVDPALAASLGRLAEIRQPGVAASALPLVVAQWSAAEQRERLPAAAEKVLASARGPATPEPERLRSFAALARLPFFPATVRAALAKNLADPERRAPVLETLRANPAPDASALLVESLALLPPQEKAAAVESLLGRRDSALALLSALESGAVTPAIAGPSALSRLLDHSDPAVKKKAAPLVARLRGATEARDVIITRLLPEVEKPGNVEAGRAAFAACAVCHQFRGQGQAVAPVLDGMGIHSSEVLLTHIIDPNREVEPSFLAWNVGTNDGQTHSGVISRETAGSLFLKNATGEVEVPRARITSQVNTGKSLMPEGFEALGAEVLRDLVTYVRSGEQRFHAIAFGRAATADGSRGVYLSQDSVTDRVSLKKYGLTVVQGVPFSLPDPAGAPGGKNVIVLKGGAQKEAFSLTLPETVDLPVNQPAGRLHLLGAVAGWGWPAVGEKIPVVRLTVHYADGPAEEIVFTNGVDFADHIARIDVPGSAPTDLVHKGQMRSLWRDLARPGALVTRVALASFNKGPAPLIAALTLESPDSTGKLAPPPPAGGPVAAAPAPAMLPAAPVPGKLRVLLAGGGSSHDFAQWFEVADQKILTEAGFAVTAYTGDPASAVEQLARAEVFLLSANDPAYQQNPAFREALDTFTARGGGLVLLHPATWQNWALWPKYNATYVGGGARSHDAYGPFTLTVKSATHPVMARLPESFSLKDELYHVQLVPESKAEVLLETSPAAKTHQPHPSVWISPHPKARIVCIAPGHDAAAHGDPNFQRLLRNAVQWAGALRAERP